MKNRNKMLGLFEFFLLTNISFYHRMFLGSFCSLDVRHMLLQYVSVVLIDIA